LVNALINAKDHLDDRVLIRHELLELGIVSVIDKLRGWIDSKRGDPRFEDFKGLGVQCDLFTHELKSDKKATTRNEMDLSYESVHAPLPHRPTLLLIYVFAVA
jgi:hypothetical protein